jgi:hypothetical protein
MSGSLANANSRRALSIKDYQLRHSGYSFINAEANHTCAHLSLIAAKSRFFNPGWKRMNAHKTHEYKPG